MSPFQAGAALEQTFNHVSSLKAPCIRKAPDALDKLYATDFILYCKRGDRLVAIPIQLSMKNHIGKLHNTTKRAGKLCGQCVGNVTFCNCVVMITISTTNDDEQLCACEQIIERLLSERRQLVMSTGLVTMSA